MLDVLGVASVYSEGVLGVSARGLGQWDFFFSPPAEFQEHSKDCWGR